MAQRREAFFYLKPGREAGILLLSALILGKNRPKPLKAISAKKASFYQNLEEKSINSIFQNLLEILFVS
jgi:hypothetical protein